MEEQEFSGDNKSFLNHIVWFCFDQSWVIFLTSGLQMTILGSLKLSSLIDLGEKKK
jgi:hypothetical protein